MNHHCAKLTLIGMAMAATALLFHPHASAAENEETKKGPDAVELEQLTVYGAPIDMFMMPLNVLEPVNKESYTEKSISVFGRQSNINVFKVIEMSPSINYSAVDALGTNENGFHDSIRIRGKKQTGPGNLKSYDGVPIHGNPGGGKTIFDLENIDSIDIYKGYIPVDKGLGFSNLVGKVDMNIKRPSHTLGGEVSQSFGSDNYYRTFLRLDTGDIGKASAFGSFSETLSDKYKGDGDLERTNGSMGVVFNPTDRFKTELFVTHNRDDHHNYYTLTYAETRDLDKYFDKDYGNDKTNSQYYDYNKQHFEDTALVANLETNLTSDSKISLKPYYFNDQGTYYYASSANVVKWDMDHEVFGGILKYEKNISKEINAKLGFWTHSQEPPGPPTNQEKYTVGSNGLKFAGYAVLADNDNQNFYSPFTELSGQLGNFVYSAGMRYLYFELGALRSYTNGTNASTSQDYEKAIRNGILDPWASVGEKVFREWLPSAYLGYNVAPNATIYVDYTRTYGLDVNLFPTYVQQRANFVSRGVTLQELWDKLDLEISDNFDFGVKYKMKDISLNPNAFVSFVKNKQARVYDANYNVTYPYNGADAFAYGFELPVSGPIMKNLDFLLALSYNKYYFTEDLKTGSNSTVAADGNQVPDAPEYMAKGALTYKLFGVELTPSVRYMSKRYGDVLNTEKVDDATIVDFDIAYALKDVFFAKSVEIRLTATNIFDTKYISAINTADDALAATTNAATYQTGAPFGIYGNIKFMF